MHWIKSSLALRVIVSGIAVCSVASGSLDNSAAGVDISNVRVRSREVVAGRASAVYDISEKSVALMVIAKASKNGFDIAGWGDSIQQKGGPQDDKPAEEVYKNIQVFKGVPSKRILAIMGGFKMALGVDCTHCHVQDQWDKDDLKPKLVARKMVSMVLEINNKLLADVGKVSCYTCHRGDPHPLLSPPSK